MARANALQTSPYVPHDIPIITDNITFTEYYLIYNISCNRLGKFTMVRNAHCKLLQFKNEKLYLYTHTS